MVGIKNTLKKIDTYIKYKYYSSREEKIKRAVFSKKKIKVVFFVLYESMWKCDSLFKLLLKNDNFEPYILSTPYPNHPLVFSENNQKELEQFFVNKGYPFIKGYDFDSKQWFDIVGFSPDIVFYQQPYNAGYKGFKIESLWNKCLFGYIPYCFAIETEEHFHNNLLQNICWRSFIPTKIEADMLAPYLFGKGKNICVSGFCMVESLTSQAEENDFCVWKQSDRSIKRVIWAPHHSILPGELGYSNFLEIAQDMLQLAEEYKGRIQFVFKPHPVLKRKLYKLDGWGIERTDKYYASWKDGGNSTIAEGDYIGLFRSSDAMIHDCSSFSAEYLYTKHPVAYISKPNHSIGLSELGQKCYDLHYKVYNIKEIKEFLDNVVLYDEDYMLTERIDFVKSILLPPGGKTVAENCFQEFISEINKYDKRQ